MSRAGGIPVVYGGEDVNASILLGLAWPVSLLMIAVTAHQPETPAAARKHLEEAEKAKEREVEAAEAELARVTSLMLKSQADGTSPALTSPLTYSADSWDGTQHESAAHELADRYGIITWHGTGGQVRAVRRDEQLPETSEQPACNTINRCAVKKCVCHWTAADWCDYYGV